MWRVALVATGGDRSVDVGTSLLRLAAAVSTVPGMVDPDSLAVYRVLHAAATDADRRELLDTTLGPVLALPPRQRDATLRTLAAAIDSRTQRDAAAALSVHAKTMRYRVQQAEALLGLRLDEPAHRRRIDIALHLLRLGRL